jgi:hypothetical protein
MLKQVAEFECAIAVSQIHRAIRRQDVGLAVAVEVEYKLIARTDISGGLKK